MEIDQANNLAELGYWIGVPFWGQGYCTEAGLAVLEYGFVERKLNRIQAMHFTRNPASGRVLEKIGMKCEGLRKQVIKKWGEYVDLAYYATLREQYPSS